MKDRILKGWNFMRILYLVLGGIVFVQSMQEKQWIGMALGAYFAAMGLFAFGCAAGNCYGGACNYDAKSKRNLDTINPASNDSV